MSQEPHNKDEKQFPRFQPNRNRDENSNPQRKGPRFSIWWPFFFQSYIHRPGKI